MVTATRNRRQQIIERFVLEGEPPTVKEICELGIDVKFFIQRFAALKPQLDSLSGYKPLEKWCEHWHRPDLWVDMVDKANLTGVQCLRFEGNTGDSYKTQLFHTDPYVTLDIEVFLTRTGKWIVWARSDVRDVPPRFTTHDTIESLLTRFKQIAGKKYDYVPYRCYYELLYYPEHQNGRHRVISVPLVLAMHLGKLLVSSVYEKKKKLRAQKRVWMYFGDTEDWAGLSRQ